MCQKTAGWGGGNSFVLCYILDRILVWFDYKVKNEKKNLVETPQYTAHYNTPIYGTLHVVNHAFLAFLCFFKYNTITYAHSYAFFRKI